MTGFAVGGRRALRNSSQRRGVASSCRHGSCGHRTAPPRQPARAPGSSSGRPTSSAGSARCRRRTTASRCGRSARGCGAGRPHWSSAPSRERQIVRTWLMRGTIHFAAPEDVRWLLGARALRASRSPRSAAARSSASRPASIDRSRDAGRRGARRRPAAEPLPSCCGLLEDAGVATTGQRGYHDTRAALPGRAHLHRADAGQAADVRPARRLGPASARARADARRRRSPTWPRASSRAAAR